MQERTSHDINSLNLIQYQGKAPPLFLGLCKLNNFTILPPNTKMAPFTRSINMPCQDPQLEDLPNPDPPMPTSVVWPSDEFQKEMESLLTRATNQCPDWIDKYPHMHAATVCAFDLDDIKKIQTSWSFLFEDGPDFDVKVAPDIQAPGIFVNHAETPPP